MRIACAVRQSRAGSLWALGAVCVLTTATAAQEPGASLTIGAAQVRFADEATFTSLTLTPALTLRGTPGVLSLSGTFAQVGPAGWSQQGVAVGSLFTAPLWHAVVLEAAGSAGGTQFPGGFATGQALAGARAHRAGTRLSGWIGGFGGGMSDGSEWRAVRQGEVGLALSGRLQRASLMASPASVDDTLRYTDFLAAYGSSRGRWDMSLSVGARSGTLPMLVGGDQRVWGGMQLQLWLASRQALLVGVGTYPVDVTQGFPAGRYVSISWRIGTRRSIAAQAQSDAWASRDIAVAAGVQAFHVTRTADGELAITVRADDAERVELSGDLTRWAPVLFARGSDGQWWARLPAPSADLIEVALRIDGGAWIAPPGTDATRDEFGGVSGRLALPPATRRR